MATKRETTQREMGHFLTGAMMAGGMAVAMIGAIVRCTTDGSTAGVRTQVLKACAESCDPRPMREYNPVLGCVCGETAPTPATATDKTTDTTEGDE